MLIDKCIVWAKANRYPEMTDQTVWEMSEEERTQLVPSAGRDTVFRQI